MLFFYVSLSYTSQFKYITVLKFENLSHMYIFIIMKADIEWEEFQLRNGIKRYIRVEIRWAMESIWQPSSFSMKKKFPKFYLYSACIKAMFIRDWVSTRQKLNSNNIHSKNGNEKEKQRQRERASEKEWNSESSDNKNKLLWHVEIERIFHVSWKREKEKRVSFS